MFFLNKAVYLNSKKKKKVKTSKTIVSYVYILLNYIFAISLISLRNWNM